MSDRDFLKAYTEYASDVTDAPIEFHDFVGLSVVAAAVSGKVYFEYGDQKIRPNLYIILLAPSSLYRKSTAIGIGRRLLEETCSDVLLPNEFSHEKLVEVLRDHPQGIFVYNEFISLASLLERDYMASTKAFLTDIYDCPRVYRRMTKGGDIEINKPCVNILAATTTHWFLEKARERDMYGGFYPRFLYVPATKKVTTIAFPEPADDLAKGRLGRMLEELWDVGASENTDKKMSFSPEARKHYAMWYKAFEAKSGTISSMSAFHARLTVYCLKFACLYELSATKELIVGLEAMENACRTTDWLFRQLKTLEDEFTFTRFAVRKKKVLDIIINQPGIARAELIRITHLSARELDEVEKTLLQEERIEIRVEKRGRSKKATKCYYPVEKR